MKCHYAEIGVDRRPSRRGICGVWTYWSQDITTDPHQVTCGNCRRNKRYPAQTDGEGET